MYYCYMSFIYLKVNKLTFVNGVFYLNKNIMAILLSFMFILSLCSASDININNKNKLSADIIKEYENSEREEKFKLKSKILQNIFTSMGKDNKVPMTDTTNLTILHGDVIGDKQDDIIFVVNMSPKNTVVVVYEKVGDNYEYRGIVDDFFDIKAIQLLPIGNNQKNLIVIREYADQMLGAFEKSTFLRAYKADNNKFQLVLNVLENHKSYWNELWDKTKPQNESHWLLVKQNTNSNLKDNKLYVTQDQFYQQSKNTNLIDIPKDEDFDTIKEREISQMYYWNDKWQHFIIGEGTELKTGEKVAILEDMSEQPFSLVQKNNTYRIKRKNGEIEFIDKNNIVRN